MFWLLINWWILPSLHDVKQRKAANSDIWETQRAHFCFIKHLNRLFHYQNSWWLIFWWSTYQLIDESFRLLMTWNKEKLLILTYEKLEPELYVNIWNIWDFCLKNDKKRRIDYQTTTNYKTKASLLLVSSNLITDSRPNKQTNKVQVVCVLVLNTFLPRCSQLSRLLLSATNAQQGPLHLERWPCKILGIPRGGRKGGGENYFRQKVKHGNV